MSEGTGRLAVVAIGLLVLLTYLLLRGTTPGTELREHRLQALDALALHQAALHRDVLRARTGLLRNYDPLVSEIEDLRRAIANLQEASRTARDAEGSVGQRVEGLAVEVSTQEALLDRFKSTNALLQNSLSYFAHVSARLGGLSGGEASLSAAVGALANAMFRFVGAPSDTTAPTVAAALYRIDGFVLSGRLRADAESLTAHGWLIVTNLPVVDDTMARLLATRLPEQVQELQGLFLADYRRTEARATVFRVLLYLTSLALLAYLVRLYLRLRANARALAERSHALQVRSDFERLLAGLSARFIDQPARRINDGLALGVEQLGQHLGAQRAYALLSDGKGTSLQRSHAWERQRSASGESWDELLTVGLGGSLDNHQRLGCLVVSDVALLPEGGERAILQRHGIGAWLCVPLWHAGRRIGILGVETAAGDRRWPDDDLRLMRLAGEILANAVGRQRAEEERDVLETRLRRAQRLEAIGTLAGGIAHNFNNILGAILGYAEMALAGLPPGNRSRRHIDEVHRAGERAKGIIDQILTFGRRVEPRREPVRLAALVDEASSLLRASLPATVTIRTRHVDESAAIVDGDASQLQQVVVNLSANAAQAMAERGVVDVVTDTLDVADERTLSHGTLAEGRYVRLTVQDSGPGIDPAILDRIFEPFFTTKHTRGTGLGLATVHGIVADHDGALHVSNRPERGSIFEVYFPRSDSQPATDAAIDAPPPVGHGEIILLAEDDEPLRLLGEEMLATLGYEPVGFDRGTHALAAFDAEPQRFDLLLADDMMPEMTGTQLAAAVHRLRPDLPILLMTGYGGSPEPAPRTNGIRGILKKPLRRADLARQLARHLHGGGADDTRHPA